MLPLYKNGAEIIVYEKLQGYAGYKGYKWQEIQC